MENKECHNVEDLEGNCSCKRSQEQRAEAFKGLGNFG